MNRSLYLMSNHWLRLLRLDPTNEIKSFLRTALPPRCFAEVALCLPDHKQWSFFSSKTSWMKLFYILTSVRTERQLHNHLGEVTGWRRWPSTCLSGHVWHWPPHLPAYYCLWTGVGGVYRLVLDGQLLCLAVDQRPNNYGVRGTLPVSSCHPVAWYCAQQ